MYDSLVDDDTAACVVQYGTAASASASTCACRDRGIIEVCPERPTIDTPGALQLPRDLFPGTRVVVPVIEDPLCHELVRWVATQHRAASKQGCVSYSHTRVRAADVSCFVACSGKNAQDVWTSFNEASAQFDVYFQRLYTSCESWLVTSGVLAVPSRGVPCASVVCRVSGCASSPASVDGFCEVHSAPGVVYAVRVTDDPREVHYVSTCAQQRRGELHWCFLVDKLVGAKFVDSCFACRASLSCTDSPEWQRVTDGDTLQNRRVAAMLFRGSAGLRGRKQLQRWSSVSTRRKAASPSAEEVVLPVYVVNVWGDPEIPDNLDAFVEDV